MSTSVIPPSVKILLAKGKADTDINGLADVVVKVPSAGRSIVGGDGCFMNQSAGDYLKIELRDDDDVLGGGAGQVLFTFHDLGEPDSHQGWFFLGGNPMQIVPLMPTEFSELPGDTYLHIMGYKDTVPQTPDTLFINLKWGLRYR